MCHSCISLLVGEREFEQVVISSKRNIKILLRFWSKLHCLIIIHFHKIHQTNLRNFILRSSNRFHWINHRLTHIHSPIFQRVLKLSHRPKYWVWLGGGASTMSGRGWGAYFRSFFEFVFAFLQTSKNRKIYIFASNSNFWMILSFFAKFSCIFWGKFRYLWLSPTEFLDFRGILTRMPRYIFQIYAEFCVEFELFIRIG